MNRPRFAKLKPSKLVLTINNLLADLLIGQTFFHQMFEMSQFAKLPAPAKLSRYTVVVKQSTLNITLFAKVNVHHIYSVYNKLHYVVQ